MLGSRMELARMGLCERSRADWFGLCGWLFGFVYDTCYDMAVCMMRASFGRRDVKRWVKVGSLNDGRVFLVVRGRIQEGDE